MTVHDALKPGWRRVKFGDVVRLSKARSQNPLEDGYDRYVGLEHLEPGDLRVRSWGNVADGTTFTNVFKPGQVLFGKRRAYQRKVAVADFSGVCSGDIYVLESKNPKDLLPELLPFICQTDAFFEHAIGTSAGSLSPRTNWASLSDFEIILPSIQQQTDMIEILNLNLQLMQSYALLGQSLQIVYQSSLDSLFALDAKNYLNLETVARVIDCKHVTPKLAKDGIPMVSPGTIRWGSLDLRQCKIVEGNEFERMMDHIIVKRNDIVMSRNQSFGIASYVDSDERFILGQDTVAIQAHSIDPEYLYASFRSKFVQSQISQFSMGSTFKRINVKDIKLLKIPIADPTTIATVAQVKRDGEASLSSFALRIEEARKKYSWVLSQTLEGNNVQRSQHS